MKRFYKVEYGRLVAAEKEDEINISFLSELPYRGACLSHVDFAYKDDLKQYESITHIANIHNREKTLPGTIRSIKGDRHIEIVSPFSELESVGNELALYLLLEYGVMTFVAVSCFYKNTLVLFVGKSNSGKTTSARLLKLQTPEVNIVSDDFVCLRQNNYKLEFSVPIWDILSNCSTQMPWRTIDHVVLVDLDKDFTISSFSDLFSYTIGSNFSSEISFQIYKTLIELKRASFSCEILTAEYRNFHSISDQLQRYFSNVLLP